MTDFTIDPAKANNENFADKEITVRLDAEAIQSDNLGDNVTSCKAAFELGSGNIISYDVETEE